MIPLKIIWLVSMVLLALSIGAWLGLICLNLVVSHRLKRRQRYQDEWLDLLIDWMEPDCTLDKLPRARSTAEMEAVLTHIRELAENFRGQYRERLSLALEQVGARAYALGLLRSRLAYQRANAVAILKWCTLTHKIVRELRWALEDPDAKVRLEAASTLVSKGRLSDPEHVLECLCRDEAAESLVARDIFREWGGQANADWIRLLRKDWPDEARILLLEAAGAAGNPEWTPWIAREVSHPCPDVACAALRALEEFADPDAAGSAVAACTHSCPRVRRQAARTLRVCGRLENAEDPLLHMLEDDCFEVRRVALRSLIELGGRARLAAREPADYWQQQLYQEAGLAAGNAP